MQKYLFAVYIKSSGGLLNRKIYIMAEYAWQAEDLVRAFLDADWYITEVEYVTLPWEKD